MDIIERYVYDVCRRIRKNKRARAEREIKLQILSLAAEKAPGRAPSEEEVKEILISMGPPPSLALQYDSNASGYIEPVFSGVFRCVLRILLTLALFGLLFFLLFETSRWTVGWLSRFPAAFLGTLVSITVFFIVIILVLSIIERVSSKSRDSDGTGWDPNALPKLIVKKIENATDALLQIITALAGFVLFNFLLNRFGFINPADGSFVRLFDASAAGTLLPLWNIVFCLSFVYALCRLILGHETLFTRILHISIPIASIVTVIYMISLPAIISRGFITAISPEQYDLKTIFDGIYYGVLGLTILGSLADIIKSSAALSERPPVIKF